MSSGTPELHLPRVRGTILLVDDEANIADLVDMYLRKEGFRVPVIVVPCSSKEAYLDRYAEPDKGWADREDRRWPVPYWHIDTGMASLLILQTAVDEGLGACFFGIPREPVSYTHLTLPTNSRV